MKIILFGLSLLLVSCKTAPVYDIVDKPIAVEPPLTLEQTSEAILLATSKLGWELEHVEPGLALATLHIRGHMAQVQIAYTPQQYSITYKNSSLLKYDGVYIHNNFNRWIKNLDKYIQYYLSIKTKMVSIENTRIAVVYDIEFDIGHLTSGDAMDDRFRQEVPVLCDGSSTNTAFDVILAAICIVSGVTYVGAWSLDKTLYAGDTKEWQPCLKRFSTTLRSLDGVAVVKQPIHNFMDTQKFTLSVEHSSESEYLAKRYSQILSAKYAFRFEIKGPEIKNIGDDGIVAFEAVGVLYKISNDGILRTTYDHRLRDWRKVILISLTSFCEAQTDNLIKQQIKSLIESLLKQISTDLPQLLLRH